MSKIEDVKRMLSDMSLKEALLHCGRLQISFEDTCRLLSGKCNTQLLLKDLQNPETTSYSDYQEGVAEGNLKLAEDLEANISDPKAKDAYKNLSGERGRQSVNAKLKDLFGI